jgi:hypothetical protein
LTGCFRRLKIASQLIMMQELSFNGHAFFFTTFELKHVIEIKLRHTLNTSIKKKKRRLNWSLQYMIRLVFLLALRLKVNDRK